MFERLLGTLKKEIDVTIREVGVVKNSYLEKMFYLGALADGFDADLMDDIASAFRINSPDSVTDTAWEMAYSGLVAWDFDKKTYVMNPTLRQQILNYMNKERKNDAVKVLETIAKSYENRAKILPNRDHQLEIARDYRARAKRLSESK